jgi:hypothetical protein
MATAASATNATSRAVLDQPRPATGSFIRGLPSLEYGLRPNWQTP